MTVASRLVGSPSPRGTYVRNCRVDACRPDATSTPHQYPGAWTHQRHRTGANRYPQKVMAISGLEAGLFLVWSVGVLATLFAGARGGFTLRARVVLLLAIFMPVLGSVLAIAYLILTLVRNPRSGHRTIVA